MLFYYLFIQIVQVQVTTIRPSRGEQKQYVCATHGVLRWSWWVFSRTLLTQAGNSPCLFKLIAEHGEDQHHAQTLWRER